ncbi:hypothetical protein [Acidiphilium sp. JA12-A1]|uniref:hypothetical protein n=1 Tax=Acidiphilium sp. JA12-A1 TaxID=1464546 RepID=UPI000461F851|nr:hypothetical protein [Acidiphilium sp. JA12-A1]KDM65108.1 MarR family transcriptional regulator [Acidiphilium sp. JA12-A1]
MADARLTDEDYEMLASFRFALRKFIAFSEAAARRDGLTPRQHQALLGIRAMQGQGLRGTAKRLHKRVLGRPLSYRRR